MEGASRLVSSSGIYHRYLRTPAHMRPIELVQPESVDAM